MNKKILKSGNPNATFIEVKIENKKILAYIDTGATLYFAKRSILKKWEKLKRPLRIIVADKSSHEIWYVAQLVQIIIAGKIFTAKTIYQHDSGLHMIIGNNFLKLYEPFIQRDKTISLKAPEYKDKKSGMINTKIITRNEIIKSLIEE